MKWISFMYTYITSLLDLPPTHQPLSSSFPRLSESWAPCTIRQVPSICFTHGGIYVSPNLPFHPIPYYLPPCPYVCSLCLHLYSYPANRFICTIFLDSTYQHEYVMFLSFWLHSVWQSLDTSTSLQRAQFCSSLWLSNNPLYICTTLSLSIHLSLNI